MPSEIMDLQGLSSSSFSSEDASFPSERQVGFWKSDTMPDQRGQYIRDTLGKSYVLSPSEKLVAVESVKSLEHPQPSLTHDQKMNHSLYKHAVGAERALSRSLTLLRPVDNDGTGTSLNVQPASYFAEVGKVNAMAAQHENSLFSSSLSELFSRKLRLSSTNSLYGHSVDTIASHFEEEEPFQSLEEIEAQTIGNLLPDDDDLFSGVTDRVENINHPSGGDDMEDLDFFSSVGGMDLGDDGSVAQIDSEFHGGASNGQLGACNLSVAGEQPYGEHPSRTLFVRNINSNVEESELRAVFEQYGDIRTLYTACKHRGFVMISYYDIRAAKNAMKALQNRPLRRRKLDIHYSIPKDNPSEKDFNQGTLAVFNLDSSVSNDDLHQIFGVYGEIKEIHGTPHRNHDKFVEFYDVRAAEAALHALNKSDIAGKRIKLEASCPGGLRRLLHQIPPELEQDEFRPFLQQSSPPNNSTTGFSGTIISTAMDNGPILGAPSATHAPFLESALHHGISSSVPNSMSSVSRVESAGNQTGFAELSHSPGHLKFDIQSTLNFHPHSLPEYDGLNSGVHCNSPGAMAANINPRPLERIDTRHLARISPNGNPIEFSEGVFGSARNGSCSRPGNHYTWGNSYHHQPPGMIWPNSPSFVNGISVAHPGPRLHGPPRVPPSMLNPVLPINNQHVGSVPAVNPSLWDRQHAYAGESPDASSFHPCSLGSMRISNNSLHSMEFLSPKMFPHVGGNCLELPMPPQNVGFQSQQQRSMVFPGRGQMIPMINTIDAPGERARSRRNEGSISQADKKQYELDIDRILQGEDTRTTLMIKNIPNKYTSKMLLAAIDERHKGTYNFVYLPIDFKNKCNVGYAFINMIDPRQIIPFYQAFNGKKWEKFNSEKVASLAYARIQGKAALIAHFQNSSLMNEDKRCRPILFNTDGPNAGDQVPFPMGVNVRTRTGKPQTIIHEENQQGSPSNLAGGEDSSNGDASSGSGKESD
ncbi:PREDICTED: protein MEI2-like 4 isoform X1 [Populus euphratica]|uniref:Protein MEI2-like 4 isoform X1 n=1 Tax=Populus euphratica TaxID=75702 RepID=A0AAJ6U216_POPEU|nr:PREDICTED: protein MEI2-like 4 isoform X1 [Populus euphratica]XP_011020885.1 PREDICTED: protein MEI2-like 4 isoform X1 [Populus euphratica]